MVLRGKYKDVHLMFTENDESDVLVVKVDASGIRTVRRKGTRPNSGNKYVKVIVPLGKGNPLKQLKVSAVPDNRLKSVKQFIDKKLDKAVGVYTGDNLSRAKSSIAYSAGLKLLAMDYRSLAPKHVDDILSPLGYTFEEVMEMIRRDATWQKQ